MLQTRFSSKLIGKGLTFLLQIKMELGPFWPVCVKKIQLTRPELAFIIVTRAMIGAGIALLLADRLSAEQRKAVGATLATVGLVTTIPAVWAIFGKCE